MLASSAPDPMNSNSRGNRKNKNLLSEESSSGNVNSYSVEDLSNTFASMNGRLPDEPRAEIQATNHNRIVDNVHKALKKYGVLTHQMYSSAKELFENGFDPTTNEGARVSIYNIDRIGALNDKYSTRALFASEAQAKLVEKAVRLEPIIENYLKDDMVDQAEQLRKLQNHLRQLADLNAPEALPHYFATMRSKKTELKRHSKKHMDAIQNILGSYDIPVEARRSRRRGVSNSEAYNGASSQDLLHDQLNHHSEESY